METSLFDYDLPPALIAQQPAEPRDGSRLLVLHRGRAGEPPRIEHRRFGELGEYLEPGDLLVANDSRVIPARLHGRKPSGGAVEIFLLRQEDEQGQLWQGLVRGKGLSVGATVLLKPSMQADDAAQPAAMENLTAEIIAVAESGVRTIRFSAALTPLLPGLGEIPLPPYITQYAGDRERYQTVYSRPAGSAAAPTAGLHFTPELLLALRSRGVHFATVTLHVGLDTFKPVTAATVEEHRIHREWAELSTETARRVNEVTLQGGRVVAVGTTSARTLEWAARTGDADAAFCPWQRVSAFAGDVSIYIRPGYHFRAVDRLITNFHLPRSSLLLMVSAFVGQHYPDDPDAGRRQLLAVYAEAKALGYRFYSFGDAMLIL